MYILLIIFVAASLIILSSVQTVQQGTVAVITVFGKYKRIMQPGLNLKFQLLNKFINAFQFKIVR